MSAATKDKSVPSGPLQSNKHESKTIQTGSSRHRNPPELQRNETAAKAKPVQQASSETYNEHKEDNYAQQSTEDEDDPCVKKKAETVGVKTFRVTPGPDPRFQQQNQTLRCHVMYTDFYRCEDILGEGHEACTWFRDVFTSICPNAWVSRWDELRKEGRMAWSGGKGPAKLPSNFGD